MVLSWAWTSSSSPGMGSHKHNVMGVQCEYFNFSSFICCIPPPAALGLVHVPVRGGLSPGALAAHGHPGDTPEPPHQPCCTLTLH